MSDKNTEQKKSVVSSSYIDVCKQWRGRAENFLNTRLIFVVRGKLRFWLYKCALDVYADTAVVINKGERLRKWFSEDGGAAFYIIDIDGFDGEYKNGQILYFEDVSAVRSIIGLIDKKSGKERDLLLSVLENELSKSSEPENITNTVYYREACKYIDAHINENITLDLLCEVLDISRGHINRVFSDFAKMSLKSYITEKRVSHIKKLLEFSDYTLIEMAQMLGFDDANLLNKFFTYHTDMSPSEYRAQKTLNKKSAL